MRTGWLMLLLLALPSSAATLDELRAADKLRVSTWVEPEAGIVLGQEVRLVIEVSTPRWFAGGTRIKAPEVDGLVILRRNDFAINLSRREGADTWVIQRWELELYPQREGNFALPPVRLQLAVNDEDAGIVRGEIQTGPLAFSAATPEAMRGIERWLATPSLQISQGLDRDPAALVPGDAFTRTLEIRATHVTSMMLPEPAFTTPAGLAAYPDLPELSDRSNRGEATAIRRQSITYVVVEPGQYQLPGVELPWWNTATGQRETAVLPTLAIDAGEAGFSSAVSAPTWLWPALVAAAVITAVLLLASRRLRREPDPLNAAARALARGDAGAATRALYAWLNRARGKPGWLSLRESAAAVGESPAADKLLASSFGKSHLDVKDARSLVSKLARSPRRQIVSTGLALNPHQPRK